MELRVSVTQSARSTVVHVDGWLMAGNVTDLERLVATITGPAVIDLSNLVSADDAGVATLRSLAGRGARLAGATPYIRLLLAEESSAAPSGRRRSRQSRTRRTGPPGPGPT